jgi:hypothetical protein
LATPTVYELHGHLGTLQSSSRCSLRGCPQIMHRWRLPSTIRVGSFFIDLPAGTTQAVVGHLSSLRA